MRDRPPVKLFICFTTSVLCFLLWAFFTPLRAQVNPHPSSPQPRTQTSPQTARQSFSADSFHEALRFPIADLARTNLLTPLLDSSWICFSASPDLPATAIPSLPYHRANRRSDRFPSPAEVNKNTVLRFTIANSGDQPASAWLCPGFLVRAIRLYRLQAGDRSVIPIADILPDDPDSLGYRKIMLLPRDTATFFAVLQFIKASSNSVEPTLTGEALIHEAILINHENKTAMDIITNLFAGIMIMMIFYAVSEYMQSAKPEFLYYVGYAVCIGVLLFLKSTLHQVTTSFNFFFESFLDNILFSSGYISYIFFHRQFLETRRNFVPLDRFLRWGTIGITVLTLAFIGFYFLSPDFRIANSIENSIKILLLLISVGFVLIGLTYHDRLMNYIVLGNLSLCLLSIVSEILILTNFKLIKENSVFNLALFYYETGITIELLFFLFALSYKNKREIIFSIQKEEKLKLETERKEMEKQVAVLAAKQDERNRISVDMHDELGSGVTAIRLMSEIVKSKMKGTTFPEIEKISHSANELLNKMNTIIWTMTSSNDTLENLVAYIRSYAVEFFENTSIDCIFSMPAAIPPRELSGEKRRNIFLSVKEALNNVVKHSQCSVVRINIMIQDRMIIEIQDDGVGIDLEKLRKFGNGLNNMRKRMASINGEFNIENRKGTRTTFYLAL